MIIYGHSSLISPITTPECHKDYEMNSKWSFMIIYSLISSSPIQPFSDQKDSGGHRGLYVYRLDVYMLLTSFYLLFQEA